MTGWPFEYTFLDQHFENLYRSDQQMSSVVTIMTVISILIACIGLFGLAAITTERKIKEIGIRKVLGASIMQITYVLSKDFVRLIIIAFVLASPVTYFLLEEWLANFAFRINVNMGLFIFGGITALIIAMATMGYHILKSASTNPAESLRME